jgi:hypothetical protein
MRDAEGDELLRVLNITYCKTGMRLIQLHANFSQSVVVDIGSYFRVRCTFTQHCCLYFSLQDIRNNELSWFVSRPSRLRLVVKITVENLKPSLFERNRSIVLPVDLC